MIGFTSKQAVCRITIAAFDLERLLHSYPNQFQNTHTPCAAKHTNTHAHTHTHTHTHAHAAGSAEEAVSSGMPPSKPPTHEAGGRSAVGAVIARNEGQGGDSWGSSAEIAAAAAAATEGGSRGRGELGGGGGVGGPSAERPAATKVSVVEEWRALAVVLKGMGWSEKVRVCLCVCMYVCACYIMVVHVWVVCMLARVLEGLGWL